MNDRYDNIGQPVDQIAVRKLGGFNFMSVSQWTALPVDQKSRLIKGDLVTFLFEGEPVPLRDALLYLRSLNVDDAPAPAERPTWFQPETGMDFDPNA